MSKYVQYYNDRQDACRTLVTQYMNWLESENMEPQELPEVVGFFTKVAKRFGLIREFRQRGVI